MIQIPLIMTRPYDNVMPSSSLRIVTSDQRPLDPLPFPFSFPFIFQEQPSWITANDQSRGDIQ